MARGSAGQVLERRRKGGTIYALRFRVYGERHYVTLGGEAEGWTGGCARTELKRVMTDVERGVWASPLRRSRARRAPRSRGAMLVLAGLRAEELGSLLWRHVDLANGRIRIEHSKAEAGLREVDPVPFLRDTLRAHRNDARYIAPDDPVFPPGPADVETGTTSDFEYWPRRWVVPTSC